MRENEQKRKQPCSCMQTATDLLKLVSLIKEGMLKEVKCKVVEKNFLTNFETEYYFDCRIKNQEK